MGMAVDLFVDGALDDSLRWCIGGRSVRAEGNAEVVDFSSVDIVDETC